MMGQRLATAFRAVVLARSTALPLSVLACFLSQPSLCSDVLAGTPRPGGNTGSPGGEPTAIIETPTNAEEPALQPIDMAIETWQHRLPFAAGSLLPTESPTGSEGVPPSSGRNGDGLSLRCPELSVESWLHRPAVCSITMEPLRLSNASDVDATPAVAMPALPRPPVAESQANGRSEPAGRGTVGPSPALAAHRDSSVPMVAFRAVEDIHYGIDLADRGAFFAAQKTFTKALQLIADALDADEGTQVHRHAMDAGLRALREADDFAPATEHGEGDISLSLLSAAHHTPVLKDKDISGMTAVATMQAYYEYGLEQLTQAGGREPVASLALYGLARVEAMVGAERDEKRTLGSPKAVALYQAALAVNPNNAPAANELGVLLARYGQLRRAKDLLMQSVAIQPQPATWHNLSVVCQRLGESEEGELARKQQDAMLAAQGGNRYDANGMIRWVDVKTFVESAAPVDVQTPPPGSKGSVATGAAGSAAAAKREGWWLNFGLFSGLGKKPSEGSDAPRSAGPQEPAEHRDAGL